MLVKKQTLKQCKNSISKENIWKYMNKNRTAPNLYATIKLHKSNIPIRPELTGKMHPVMN
jgi:hypothetical protein